MARWVQRLHCQKHEPYGQTLSRVTIVWWQVLTKAYPFAMQSASESSFKSQRITQTKYYHLQSIDAVALRLCGLPKIYKEDIPMHPIVSYINSPPYSLFTFLFKLLSPLVAILNLR